MCTNCIDDKIIQLHTTYVISLPIPFLFVFLKHLSAIIFYLNIVFKRNF